MTGVQTCALPIFQVVADPKELRAFIGDIRNAAYGISNHLNRNLGEQEQEFVADEFSISEGSAKSGKGKKQPEKQPER